MSTIRLFVVTHLNIINTNPFPRKLCVLMRREGVLHKYAGVGIMSIGACGMFHPLVSRSILPNRLPNNNMIATYAAHDLGSRAAALIRKHTNDSSFQIQQIQDRIGGHDFICGVFVPEILPMIRHSPLFGIIDILTREQIDKIKSAKKQDLRILRNISKESSAAKGLKRALSVMNRRTGLAGSSDFISDHDLRFADEILSHFQLQIDMENKERARHAPSFGRKK